MASLSIAREILEALEKINQEAHSLHSEDRAVRSGAIARIFRHLGGLESLAERRVDTSVYEAHRRTMEACHIDLPAQVSRG